MHAPLTSRTSHHVDSIEGPLSLIARQTIALAAGLVLLLSVVLVVRGLLGAFDAPTSASYPVLAAVMAEILASVFRLVWTRLNPDATRRAALFVQLGLPSICVLCVAAAVSMTEATGWAVGGAWLVAVGSELAWWYPELRLPQRSESEYRDAVASELDVSGAVEDNDPGVDEEEQLDPDVIQQITRARNEAGVEVVSGILRAEFAPGERTQNLHVAFCPPLAYEPEVITYQLDGSPLTMKVGQSEIFGTRLELRRSATAASAETATICFEVRPPTSPAEPLRS
ncbi:MAG: hypothetical protein WD070_11365 [Pirellulaceae bacterium]